MCQCTDCGFNYQRTMRNNAEDYQREQHQLLSQESIGLFNTEVGNLLEECQGCWLCEVSSQVEFMRLHPDVAFGSPAFLCSACFACYNLQNI